MKDIPFLNLDADYKELKTDLDNAYSNVMETSHFILGNEVREFEKDFANYCGAKYCIAVGNGLDALHLILRANKIGEGDEVIVPSNTFIATWLAVTYAGATPIPVEADYHTFNIDHNRLNASITPNTKAIIPVHLYGMPADMDPIMEIACSNGIKVFEDAAQAHGAFYKGRRCGNLGHAAGFSFYPTKNLGAFGDGGCIVTDDDDLATEIRKIRNYGSIKKYYHDVKGFNSRLDEIQAAFLRVKLNHLDNWNSRRKEIADYYVEKLKGISEIVLPCVLDNSISSWHIFPILYKNRDALKEYLQSKGIYTLIHYPIPPHLSDAYLELNYSVGSFPVTEKIASQELSLPMSPHLSHENVDYVVKEISNFISFNR